MASASPTPFIRVTSIESACASTTGQLLGVGFLWLTLMLAFEIAFGRLVLQAS